MAKISINNLLDAGVHFGHQRSRRNPKMKPYIYGDRNGVSIFDLRITLQQLGEACQFLQDTVSAGGDVLFVGTKRQAQEPVRAAAERTGMHYMCHRWLGGALTNFPVIQSRINYMKRLQQMETDGTMDTLPKKEVAALRREKDKLERTLGGIAEMQKTPSAMVIADINNEHIAVREANRLDVPVVAVVDSNCDPDPIEYPVPGNDDAVRAIQLTMDAFTTAVEEGLAILGKEVPAAAEEGTSEAGEETSSQSEQTEETQSAASDQESEGSDAVAQGPTASSVSEATENAEQS